MKVIKYINLFNYLIRSEELSPISAYRNIQRIRKLPKEFKQAVFDAMSSNKINLVVEGVTYQELTAEEGMKPIRAILMLDWIRREPVMAIDYMSKRRFRSPLMGLKQPTEFEQTDTSDINIEY